MKRQGGNNHAQGEGASVARMKCNVIREERSAAFPDYTSFHPGYNTMLAKSGGNQAGVCDFPVNDGSNLGC